MSEHFNDIFNSAKQHSLTDSERALLRNRLVYFMSEHPAAAPLSVRALDRIAAVLEGVHAHSRAALAVPALALILAVGGGTSYAAQVSLPGSPLYGMKVGLIEPVQGLFAVNASAKAQWNTERLERRLVEAENLAAAEKLTPAAREQIEIQINTAAMDFNENISALAETDRGAARIATAQSNLEASLAGHENVLASIGEGAPAIQDTIMPILTAVRTRRAAAAHVRSGAEAAVASQPAPAARSAALDTKKAAAAAVHEMRAAVDAARAAGSATTTVTAGESAHAEAAITIGDEKLDRGEYGEAFTTFQAALRAAQTVKVDVDAQLRLKIAPREEHATSTGSTSDTGGQD